MINFPTWVSLAVGIAAVLAAIYLTEKFFQALKKRRVDAALHKLALAINWGRAAAVAKDEYMVPLMEDMEINGFDASMSPEMLRATAISCATLKVNDRFRDLAYALGKRRGDVPPVF